MFKILTLGRGGAQVVTVVAFFSDDPSSNPPEAFSFFCNIVFEKNEHKQKRGRAWPTLKYWRLQEPTVVSQTYRSLNCEFYLFW